MKNWLLIIVFIFMAGSVYAQNAYTVNGEINGLSDGPLEMKKAFDGEVLNQTEVENGKFVFKQKGNFIGDKVYLEGHGIPTRFYFYLEPGEIKLKGDILHIIPSGTVSNNAFSKFLQAESQIYKKIDSIKVELRHTKSEAKISELKNELNQCGREIYPLKIKFAKEYNNTIMAADFLSAGTGDLTYSDMKKLLSQLDTEIPENWYTNRLKNRCEILRKTDIGQKIPDFILPDTSGNQFTFSSLRGKVVLLDFWASWCHPCREENQNVLKLYNRFHNSGFDVVSVSIDENRESWVKAIIHDKLIWHHVSSLTGWNSPVAKSLGVAYGMSGVPYTLLIGRDGRVIAHNLRGDKLKVKLEDLFEHN